MVVQQHQLNARQARAIEHLFRTGSLDIRTFEKLCEDLTPAPSRRTLQRDLAALESKGLLRHEGETTNLLYRLAGQT